MYMTLPFRFSPEQVTFFGNCYFWVHLNKQQSPTIVYDTGRSAP